MILPCLNKFLLYCIVLYCIVLYCIVLYCIVLYCIVLYVVFHHRNHHLLFNKCYIVVLALRSTVGPANDVDVIPVTTILDNSMQLDKLHAGQGGEVKRRRPSRDHIQRLSRDLDPEQQAEV